MKRGSMWTPVLAIAALLTSLAAGAGEVESQWRFRVYLDDAEIGYHEFRLEREGDRRTLQSEARFNVKFLFFVAYTYVHDNTERWDGECLAGVDAFTDDNGEISRVEGQRNGDGFVVRTTDGRTALPGCVRSFAYWDPELLRADRLLNTQTGDYLAVEIQALGEETLEVRGRAVRAQRYSLNAEELDIQLWYSAEDEWLALESRTVDGYRIRYQLL